VERVSERPTLIVGDVQGDVERLADALAPYDEDEVDTIFLGDFFQGGAPGAGGGAAAARLARARRNSRTVLGNHDLFLLAILERSRGGDNDLQRWRSRSGGDIEDVWLSRRGDWADLHAVASDPELEAWLRKLPLMLKLEDSTLVQHTDDDVYAEVGTSVDDVNRVAAAWLAEPGGVLRALRLTIGRHAFEDQTRLTTYLQHFDARRVVHGHTPHWEPAPLERHGGRAIGYDGRFSRYWSGVEDDWGPVSATVALLPPLSD
jgi:hypothetical protein